MHITDKTIVAQESSNADISHLGPPTQPLKMRQTEEHQPPTDVMEETVPETKGVEESTSPSLRAVTPTQVREASSAQNERFVPDAPEVEIVTTVQKQPLADPEVAKVTTVWKRPLPARPVSKRDGANIKILQERCQQLCLSLFFQEQAAIRSIGFTSAIKGEGKTFLTLMMANALIDTSSNPVTLLECNWDHPCFHEYFQVAQTPGLAEWLRGECSEVEARRELENGLTVIPAGNGKRDAVKLLQQVRQQGLLTLFANSDEFLLVDLPPVIASTYGPLAASIVEALVLVVRSGVTTDPLLSETCSQLKGVPIQGVILNQVESRIPRWIRQLL